MRIQAFQALDGDCVLVSGHRGTLLIDGGRSAAFREFVVPELASVKKLDVVAVSHIDDDHISGIVELLRLRVDRVAWQYLTDTGGTAGAPPPELPEIGGVWHNGFSELVRDNDRAIKAALMTNMQAAIIDDHVLEVERLSNFIHGERSALELVARLRPEQLDISLNREFGGKLMHVDAEARPIDIGSMTATIVGPTVDQLDALRKRWNEWLRTHRRELRKLHREMEHDVDRLSVSASDPFGDHVAAFVNALGDKDHVTTPNLASLMFLLEERDRSALFTGDGHADDVLSGLEQAGKLAPGGVLHLDVLKIPHHGSEHNVTRDFLRRVTANTYLLCGNGASTNPELQVLDEIVNARLACQHASQRAFSLLFTSSSEAANTVARKDHMRKVEARMQELRNNANGLLTTAFLGPTDSFHDIRLS